MPLLDFDITRIVLGLLLGGNHRILVRAFFFEYPVGTPQLLKKNIPEDQAGAGGFLEQHGRTASRGAKGGGKIE